MGIDAVVVRRRQSIIERLFDALILVVVRCLQWEFERRCDHKPRQAAHNLIEPGEGWPETVADVERIGRDYVGKRKTPRDKR